MREKLVTTKTLQISESSVLIWYIDIWKDKKKKKSHSFILVFKSPNLIIYLQVSRREEGITVSLPSPPKTSLAQEDRPGLV